ncbi:MAG TPA: hypothetical protein ENG73_03530 [Desulfobacterales bacterium]|nr:hypothetical protein [Desulfobacterales bacterium]
MKQVLENFKTGTTELVGVPEPGIKPGHVLIETSRSLVTAGRCAEKGKKLIDKNEGIWNILEKSS